MPHESHNISFGTDLQSRPFDALILEQAPWGDKVGHVTKLDFVKALEHHFFGGDDPNNEINCGIEDGRMDIAVLVFPYTRDLRYLLDVSYGTVQRPEVRSEPTVVEIIHFSLDDKKRTKYPVYGLQSAEWLATPWDSNGAVVVTPFISFSENELSISQKVYGSVKVTYTTVRHTYHVSIIMRDDVVENFYSSVAYAAWHGGIKWIELEAPEGAERNAGEDVTCGFGHGKTTVVPEPDDPPEDPTTGPANKTIYIDYCTQVADEY